MQLFRELRVLPFEGIPFAVATQRTVTWSGIEQNITGRLDLGTQHSVLAPVRIFGPCSKATVLATLYLQGAYKSQRYVTTGRLVLSRHFSIYGKTFLSRRFI
jgi:hypothetical protein